MMNSISLEDSILRSSYSKQYTSNNEHKLKEYEAIIKLTTGKMYQKYKDIFEGIDYDFDDALSTSTVFAMHFFGIYALSTNSDKLAIAENKLGRKLLAEEIDRKDRNGLIGFIRQRFSNAANIAASRSKNTKGLLYISFFLAETSKVINNLDLSDEILAKEYAKFGYRRVPSIEVRSISKNSSGKKWKDGDGFRVFKIDTTQQLFDPDLYKSQYLETSQCYGFGAGSGTYQGTNPEDILIEKQNSERLENEKVNKDIDKFLGLSKEGKIKTLLRLSRETKDKERIKKINKALKKIERNENCFS